jgi:hypothetical protein
MLYSYGGIIYGFGYVLHLPCHEFEMRKNVLSGCGVMVSKSVVCAVYSGTGYLQPKFLVQEVDAFLYQRLSVLMAVGTCS